MIPMILWIQIKYRTLHYYNSKFKNGINIPINCTLNTPIIINIIITQRFVDLDPLTELERYFINLIIINLYLKKKSLYTLKVI